MLAVIATSLIYMIEPVTTMRESPSDDSKVASQAPFSEQIQVQQKQGDWCQIATSDGYLGWVRSSTWCQLTEPYETTLKVTRVAVHLYGVKDTEYGPIKTVPYGSRLKEIDSSDARWIKAMMPNGQECYVQKGDVLPEADISEKGQLVDFSKEFLGLPYTWGGRSSFGFDCSGFVQMLYNRLGIQLQRDARQQILDPRLQQISLDQLEPGDLIFWGKSAQDIRHVGMSIGNGQFIHTSARENKPYLRISNLTDLEWSVQAGVFYPYRTARQLKKSI